MVQPKGSGDVRGASRPGLLILTGPSHVGKTAVSGEILATTPRPAAYLSVDGTLEQTLRRPPGDIWAQIPLAYELIGSDLEILLERGWFVLVESTFTYVAGEGDAEMHDVALADLVGKAKAHGAPCWVVQLTASRETILSRAAETNRFDLAIVSEIFALHQEQGRLPEATHVIATEALDPTEVAAAILAHVAQGT